jgi:hypothetical protein
MVGCKFHLCLNSTDCFTDNEQQTLRASMAAVLPLQKIKRGALPPHKGVYLFTIIKRGLTSKVGHSTRMGALSNGRRPSDRRGVLQGCLLVILSASLVGSTQGQGSPAPNTPASPRPPPPAPAPPPPTRMTQCPSTVLPTPLEPGGFVAHCDCSGEGVRSKAGWGKTRK